MVTLRWVSFQPPQWRIPPTLAHSPQRYIPWPPLISSVAVSCVRLSLWINYGPSGKWDVIAVLSGSRHVLKVLQLLHWIKIWLFLAALALERDFAAFVCTCGYWQLRSTLDDVRCQHVIPFGSCVIYLGSLQILDNQICYFCRKLLFRSHWAN